MRDGDLDEFFAHENGTYPHSISKNGELLGGSKSDLLGCLESTLTEINEAVGDDSTFKTDCMILDGAAFVNMLKPDGAITFKDYANRRVASYIRNKLQSCERIDIVWDAYIDNSLKLSTRKKRGIVSMKIDLVVC